MRALFVILAAALIPYFVGLQSSTIWDANEAYYAETPREMIESGDYINPSFNYQPRFNKPVLSYWAVAASYHLFGVSERSERLPIAVSAVVLILVAYALGLVGWSRQAGVLSAIALATSPRFLMFSRRIIIDMWVTMFMGLTLLCFVMAEVRPQYRRHYLLLMYAAAGFGALTKGPIAIVLPALTILVYLFVERRPGDLSRMMIPAGCAIVSLIVLPWYVALYARHGWVYIKEFFVDENFRRYAQPVGTPRRGLLFYLPVLMTDLFPWSLVLPAALGSAWIAFTNARAGPAPPLRSETRAGQAPPLRSETGATETLDKRCRVQRILVTWIAVIVLFFTFSRTKEDLYIFPVVPAEAVLIGIVLARALETSRHSVRWSLLVSGAVLGAIGIGLFVLAVSGSPYSIAGIWMIAAIAMTGAIQILLTAWRRRLRSSVLGLAGAFAAMNWVFVVVSLPDFERYKPVASLAYAIQQRASPHARIGYYRFAMPSMAFYLRQPVFEYFDVDSVRNAFVSGDEVHCLMTREDYASMRETLGPTYVVAHRPLFDVKIRSLMEGTALPDILLVSNKP